MNTLQSGSADQAAPDRSESLADRDRRLLDFLVEVTWATLVGDDRPEIIADTEVRNRAA